MIQTRTSPSQQIINDGRNAYSQCFYNSKLMNFLLLCVWVNVYCIIHDTNMHRHATHTSNICHHQQHTQTAKKRTAQMKKWQTCHNESFSNWIMCDGYVSIFIVVMSMQIIMVCYELQFLISNKQIERRQNTFIPRHQMNRDKNISCHFLDSFMWKHKRQGLTICPNQLH